jgi:hypothetical protein
LPFEKFSIDLAARLQDGQPWPDHGFAAAGEVAITCRL